MRWLWDPLRRYYFSISTECRKERTILHGFEDPFRLSMDSRFSINLLAGIEFGCFLLPVFIDLHIHLQTLSQGFSILTSTNLEQMHDWVPD